MFSRGNYSKAIMNPLIHAFGVRGTKENQRSSGNKETNLLSGIDLPASVRSHTDLRVLSHIEHRLQLLWAKQHPSSPSSSSSSSANSARPQMAILLASVRAGKENRQQQPQKQQKQRPTLFARSQSGPAKCKSKSDEKVPTTASSEVSRLREQLARYCIARVCVCMCVCVHMLY
jgi:hypothetical protein